MLTEISSHIELRKCSIVCRYISVFIYIPFFRFSTHTQMISVLQTSVMVAHSCLMLYFMCTLMDCKFIYSMMKWRYIISNLLTLLICINVVMFKVCNPIGSHKGKHKLGIPITSFVLSYTFYCYFFISGMFYYTLDNLPPVLRSKQCSIQLLCVCKYSFIKKYGIDVILQPFIEDVKKLEKVNLIHYIIHIVVFNY